VCVLAVGVTVSVRVAIAALECWVRGGVDAGRVGGFGGVVDVDDRSWNEWWEIGWGWIWV
jgi:hypothetical protein